MQSDINKHITAWVEKLSVRHAELGKFPVCPFAKSAKYEIIEVLENTIDPPQHEFELVIFVLDDKYTNAELVEIAKENNITYPYLVFLPDSKNSYSEINGIQTNNGKYNLLMCQSRASLQIARDKLATTPYYSFWSKEFLEEILTL